MKKKLWLILGLVALGACSQEEDLNFGAIALKNGLISHYSFTDGASDEGPNGKNGLAEGTTPAVDRKGNDQGAVYFDGIDDYIVVQNYSAAKEMKTIAFWAKFNELAEGMRSMELVSKSTQRQGIEVLIHEDKLQFFIMGQSRSNNVSIPISELNTEDWFFITAVQDAETKEMKLFLNGQLRASGQAPESAVEVQNLVFGSWNYEKAPRYFNGYMDDIKIYNRVFSDSEVKNLFDEER